MIPVWRQRDRKRIDKVGVLEARPGPLICFFGQTGAYGIAKHVAEHEQKMFIC